MDLALPGAEGRFAKSFENFIDAAAGRDFDLRVGVPEGNTQDIGEAGGRRRVFPAPHHPHKDQPFCPACAWASLTPVRVSSASGSCATDTNSAHQSCPILQRIVLGIVPKG